MLAVQDQLVTCEDSGQIRSGYQCSDLEFDSFRMANVIRVMDGKKLAGVIAVSAAKDVAVARRLMSNAMDVDPAQLADPDVSLRDLLR